MKRPLENIKVLDFSRVLAGPYCTMLFADLGADVLKIEKPGSGDDTRHFGPFQNDESAYFGFLNRGKKSIELNLKDEVDKEQLLQLVKETDVIVENFRPGVMKKLGLDYETLKELNPQLVYTSISGFGQFGPYSQRPAYDLVAQAMGGMTSITGHPDNPPTRTGSSLGDMSAALYAAFGTMVALYHRERTGEGQFLDIAMMDSIFAMLETNVLRYTVDRIVPSRIGSRHPISTPFDIYGAKDGYIVIAIANDPLFARLCHVVERPELIDDPRFVTDSLRTQHEKELKEIIEEWLSSYTVEEAENSMNEAGVPCSRINSIKDVVEDEHTKIREMLVEVDHPIAGPMKVPGNPVKLSLTPPSIDKAPPLLGEHNDEIKKRLLKVGID
ncbi:CoA transferase [Siminovitchia terrae]|uniref:CaiB/BaiF CoA transferase family protein n=1 Tax=Siminovitchia terrae TaxID=1914933 RepID=UPI001B12A73B|nr:CoA transferase [Siminovitchia terrae]GIN93021.1 CoA transferase [Siminovitchia terrae]